MGRSFFAAVGLIVTIVAGTAAAQTSEPQPVFKAGVDLVRLDVQVVDRDGKPVTDLRADEVEIREEGQPRPILLFQHIAEPTGPLNEVARRTVAGSVSTNEGAPRGHLYLLVFDQHHITPGNEQRARLAAERFLRSRMQPGDRVALYALPGPGPQIDFTGDVERAAAELVKVRGSLDRFTYGALGPMRVYEAYAITRGDPTVLDRVSSRLGSQSGATDILGPTGSTAPGAGSGSPAFFQQLLKEDARTMVARADQQARNFLLLLTELVRSLRAVEGRKTVLLFSEGFFTDNVTRELEQVAAAAAQSYSVVHAIDLNRRGIDIRESASLGAEQFSEIQSRLEPLGSLATETAGELYPDATANPDRVLASIAAASQDYYIVGFEPPAAASGDERDYRRIKVTVKRPGVRVSTRTGYAMTPPTNAADRRRGIDTALVAPFPQQGVHCEYTTYVFKGSTPGLQRVVVSLTARLPIAARDAATADVVFVVRNARDGRVAASGSDVIPLPDKALPGETTGIGSYRVQFDLPAGTFLMRAVVREPGGGVGSADRRLIVPALDAPGVSTSDLVLTSGEQTLPARVVAYEGETVGGLLELYARTPAQLTNAEVRLRLARPDEPEGLTVVGEMDEVTSEAGGASRIARLHLPLSEVKPGDYVALASVQLPDGSVAEVTRGVTVLPGPRPPSKTEAEAIDVRDILEGAPARTYAAAACRVAAVPRACDLVARGDWKPLAAALRASDDPSAARQGLRGLALLAQGDTAGAAAALERAVDLDPKNAGAAFLLGWAHAAGGRDREAITAWRASVVVDPKLTPAHLALADAYLRLSQPALAAQVLRAGLAALPDSPELQAKLALVSSR